MGTGLGPELCVCEECEECVREELGEETLFYSVTVGVWMLTLVELLQSLTQF